MKYKLGTNNTNKYKQYQYINLHTDELTQKYAVNIYITSSYNVALIWVLKLWV